MPANTKIANIDINLIGADDFSHTPIGRIVTWATTYGRYIMILTEIVVLLAFISRFSLDRRLTDLNEEIAQKQAIIEANSDLENEIRMIQQKLKTVRTLINTQNSPMTTLGDIQNAMPPDVYLNSLDLSEKGAKMNVVAGTTQGLSSFLSTLQANPRFSDVQVGDITSQQASGSQFDVTIQVGPPITQKK